MERMRKLYFYKRGNRYDNGNNIFCFTRELTEFEVEANKFKKGRENEDGSNEPFNIWMPDDRMLMLMMDKDNEDELVKWAISILQGGSNKVEQK